MKKIIGSILHIVCLLLIIASLISIFKLIQAYLINNCTGTCLAEYRSIIDPALSSIGFIILAVITYFTGKHFKK